MTPHNRGNHLLDAHVYLFIYGQLCCCTFGHRLSELKLVLYTFICSRFRFGMSDEPSNRSTRIPTYGAWGMDNPSHMVVFTTCAKGSLLKVLPDGRLCKVCGVRDTELDEIQTKEPYCWGYPPDRITFLNRAKLCFFCLKVYENKFEKKGISIATCLIQFGSDKDRCAVYVSVASMLSSRL
jgi:hypothetical protein